MLDVGMSELLVFGIIALLVLGPDKLPQAARFVGKWYGKVKRLVSNVQNDIDRELRLSELREQMQQEMQRIAELEQKMQTQMSELEQQKREMFVQTSKQEQTTDNISYPTYHYVKEYSSFVYVEKNIQKAQTTIFTAPDHQPEFKVAV
ncbi:Sec-independent protein translocase protein TatB [Acinetobacter junii]|uniref:Sec-independent protein translocase protein TatB n=1 Tax=Acinetobacter junii TaxID=40215 RepID=UPI00100DDE33|nr:Sec-independent protein translocase protein TatB [Acinetobacter junii]RXS99391.1 twin-arginine translocase subunit TatB [Acinetobacter junii]